MDSKRVGLYVIGCCVVLSLGVSSSNHSVVCRGRKLLSDGVTIINLAGQTRINEVVLVDENIRSLEQLAASFYSSLRRNIPEFYLQEGERTITKMWVEWNQGDLNSSPWRRKSTKEVSVLCCEFWAIRRGVDMIRVWLKEAD